MFALPPRLKHLIVSRAPMALEGAAFWYRMSGVSKRAFLNAPADGCRILAYHQTPLESAGAFRRQMEWLAENRRVVSLAEMVRRLSGGGIKEKRLVAITFDDGFANNYEVAAPILKSLGMTACFFISTDFIDLAGKGSDALLQWQERVYRFTRVAEPMTWDQVRALRRDGFEIGAHTLSHPRLNQLTDLELEREIREANTRIERECGEQPAFFAYPYGKAVFSPPRTRPVVMHVGEYRAAFSTERGWNTSGTRLDWLRRDSMEPSFSPRLLEAFLSGCFC